MKKNPGFILFAALLFVFVGNILISYDTYAAYVDTGTGIGWDSSACSTSPFKVLGNSVTASGNTFNVSSVKTTIANKLKAAGCWRGKIESVQWAAAGNAVNSDTPYCALWAGEPDYESTGTYTTIDIEDPAHAVYHLYGICTSGSTGAVKVAFTEQNVTNKSSWANDANYRSSNALSYMGGVMSVARSSWSSPETCTNRPDMSGCWDGVTKTISDVETLKANAEKVGETNDYEKYSKTFNLWRCNANNTTSCSYQPATIIFNIKKATKYYAKSNVSVKKTDGGYDEWTTTNLIESSNSVDLEVDNVFHVGETAKITFSHEVYSNKNITDVRYWEVWGKRWGDLWGSGDYSSTDTFPTGSSEDGAEIAYGNSPLTTPRSVDGLNLYSTSGDNVRRHEYTVTFNKGGSWIYCEKLKFPAGLTSEIHSQACATIYVLPVEENEYFAKSNVGIRDDNGEGNDYRTTGIVQRDGYAESSVQVPVGTVSTIVFSHNIYSKENSDKPQVEITTPNFSGVTVQSSDLCGQKNGNIASWASYSRQNDDPANVNYVANPRNCSDNVYDYISRDTYLVKFNSSGTYEICETVKVGREQKTKVCAKVTVGPRCTGSGCSNPTNVCSTWTPSSYTNSLTSNTNGVTSVVSKIKNVTVGGSSSSWVNSVYAKPGDAISWVHCYYPGVQHLYNKTVTPNNSHPEPRSMSPLTNNLNNGWFSNKYTWENKYTISNSNMTSSTAAQKTYSFTIGNIVVQKTEDNEYHIEYGAGRNKAGKTIKEINTSGTPSSVSRDNNGSGPHSWSCNKGASCSKCGTGTRCSGSGENRTCTTYCRTCYLDTCKHDSKFYRNSRDTNPAVSSAEVKVPYNFTNTAEISLKGTEVTRSDGSSETVVFAGESATVGSLKVNVNTRYNSTLKGTYATQVDDAKVQIVAYVYNGYDNGNAITSAGNGKGYNICNSLTYVSGMCSYNIHTHDGQTLNNEGYVDSSHKKIGSGTEITGSRTVTIADTDTFNSNASINVYDTDVNNKYFCVRAAVYPYTVSGNTDMSSSGSNNWYISKASCQKIARKPTFQVLGGSLYSVGDIETLAPVKNNLWGVSGDYAYRSTGGNTAAFNSWVEQSVVALGSVYDLASGAATGLNNSIYGSFENGRSPDYYCQYRVPLSFANYGCSSTTGNLGGGNVTSNTSNIGAIVDYWTDKISGDAKNPKYFSGNVDISNPSRYSVVGASTDVGTGTILRYTNASNSITLSNGSFINPIVVPNQITHIVRASGDITINSNIVYDKSSSMAFLNYIPKLIIYAEGGNININCNVSTIDAILIADETIDTCSSHNGGDVLQINGALIAKKINFWRAGPQNHGSNSGTPAEIINYDVSSILWGRYVAGSSQSNNLTMTYQHELAPRL